MIADDLNVDPMAIYHYFPNKSALLEGVTVNLMESIYSPRPDGEWKEELVLLCQSYVSLLIRYSGLLETVLSMTNTGPADVFIARFNTITATLTLPKESKKDSLDLLADYLHGFTLSAHCAPMEASLSMDMLDGPLRFYIKALATCQNL
nr:TetR/AcrR family transcriptional regulator [Desulfovibrio sp. Huiquan2017]